VDPDDPIRGRYVRLRVEGTPIDWGGDVTDQRVTLAARDGALALLPAAGDSGVTAHVITRAPQPVAVVDQPLAFFIPQHAPDPSVRAPGEELWVEVTLPRHGAPRPIRLAVKKDGVMTPLDLD